MWVDSGPNSDRAPGGKARLLLNDGQGRFVNATDRLDPVEKIGAQNAKLVDIDGDLDLDVIVDGKSTVTQLYVNDGNAKFTRDLKTIPEAARGGQPYEIEWADLDNDGDLDAVHMSWGGSRRERYRNVVLRNRLVESGKLGFDVVEDAFVGRNNEDENEFAFLDADNNGTLDLVVATLVSAPTEEKLFLNSGKFEPGFLRQHAGAFSLFADGTLDLTIADFDGDGRHDIVTAQGESTRFENFQNRLYRNFGPTDSRPPQVVRATSGTVAPGKSDDIVIRASIRDATVDDGASSVTAKVIWTIKSNDSDPTTGEVDMHHVGGGMFHAALTDLSGAIVEYQVVATDRAGNKSISEGFRVSVK